MKRLDHVDALRGIASTAVCWFHLTHGGKLLPEGWWQGVSALGFLGVEVFFVISGFVIPFAMWRTGYRWSDFGAFFSRRMLRLHPPFLIACGAALLLNVLSTWLPGYKGSVTGDPLTSILPSLLSDGTYLSAILGRPWILVVAWTLAIEVQFYLLAAFVLPLLKMDGKWWTTAGLTTLAMGSTLLSDGRFVFHYLPFFCLGWAVAWIKSDEKFNAPGWIAVGMTVAAMAATQSRDATAAGLLAAGLILFWKLRIPAPFVWLGSISYSLYLVHVPVGGRVINFFMRSSPVGMEAILLALVVSLTCAWCYCRWIEQPFHHLSRKWPKSPAP